MSAAALTFAPSIRARRMSLWSVLKMSAKLDSGAPEAIREVIEKYSEIAQVRTPAGRTVILTGNDTLALHVTKTNQANYQKVTQRGAFVDILGQGLVITDGARWLKDRRVMQPKFARPVVGAMKASIDGEISAQLDTWTPNLALQKAADRLSLVTFSRLMFDMDLSEHVDTFTRIFSSTVYETFVRDGALIERKLSKQFLADRSELYAIIDGMQAPGTGTLLDALHDASQSEQDPRAFMRDQVTNLLIAGHETSAATVVWCLLLLGMHQRTQRELRETLDAGDESYLRLVIQETLRLYPTVWSLVGREAQEEDEVAGMTIPAKAMVVVYPYAMHRNARLWQQPDAFIPERFADERVAKSPGYMPFGAGRHMCIGQPLAMLTLESTIKQVISRFEIAPLPADTLKKLGHDALLTLRPRHEPHIRLIPRQ